MNEDWYFSLIDRNRHMAFLGKGIILRNHDVHSNLIISGLFILGIVLRGVPCFTRPLWIDELYTLDSIQHAVRSIIQGRVNLHPPLYFLFFKVLSTFTKDTVVLRICSAIVSYTGGFLSVALVGKHFKCCAMALLIFVFSPAHIQYSSELRMYSFLSCFSGFSLYFLLELYARPIWSKRIVVLSGSAMLFLSLSMATHFFAALLVFSALAGAVVLLFLLKNNVVRQSALTFILWNIPVIGAGFLLINNNVLNTISTAAISTDVYTIEGKRLFDAILRQNWGTSSILQDAVFIILTGVGFYHIVKCYRREAYIMSIVTALPLLAIPILPLRHFWHERYFFFLFPHFLIMAAVGLKLIVSNRIALPVLCRSRAARFILPIILILVWYTNALPVILPATERWDILKTALKSNANLSTDCILFYPGYIAPELFIDSSLAAIPCFPVSLHIVDSLASSESQRVWYVAGYRESGSRWQQAGWYRGYLKARFPFSVTIYSEVVPNDFLPSNPRAISLYLFNNINRSTPSPHSILHSD
ncbi:MAG: hypothetical protein JXA18_02720 [Chitinispirillaceae bacterium]|nr:hypothetical protein [Chitinispirillaceae bacterium]